MKIFVNLRVLFWELPHFLKIARCISDACCLISIKQEGLVALHGKKPCHCFPWSFNKLINWNTWRQFLHISDLSEQVFENYLNSWLINSHLLQQVLCDNFLYSKCFEAKDILRYLKIHQIGFCSDFQKSTPIFNNVCYYEITLKRFFTIYSI